MNNLAINRIMSQIAPTPTVQNIVSSSLVSNFEPISLSMLEEILTRELKLSPEPQLSSSVPNPDIHFDNIYDFSLWYSQNKQHFSSQQKTALDTIEQVRGMIDAGCACKRNGREIKAHQYFEQFWINNKETDMLSTIAKIAGVNKVSVNQYCSYTR